MKKLILSLAAALTVLAVNADVKNAKPVFELNCNAGDFSLLRDISPNNSKIIIHNQDKLSWCDGPDGKALEFVAEYPKRDTPRACIEVPQPKNFDATKGFTMLVKFKTCKNFDYKKRYQFMHLAQGTDNITGFSIFFSWRTFQCRYGVKSKVAAHSNSSKVVFKADTWYEGAVVYDGKKMSVYVNKELHGTTDKAQVPPINKRCKLYIGATSPKGAGYGCTGAISYIKLYQEVFSAEDIANLD